jgi:hypothetical protein
MTNKQTTFGTVQASKLTKVHYQTIKNYVKSRKIDGFINPINGRAYVTELGIEQLMSGYKRSEHEQKPA